MKTCVWTPKLLRIGWGWNRFLYSKEKKKNISEIKVLEIQELISLNKWANKLVAFHPSLKFVFLGVDPSTEICCKSIGNPYANVQITLYLLKQLRVCSFLSDNLDTMNQWSIIATFIFPFRINYCDLFPFVLSFWSPQGKRKRFFLKGQKTKVWRRCYCDYFIG